jgi:hypothetical protein
MMKIIKKCMLRILEGAASGRREKAAATGPLALTSAKKK